MTYTFIASIEQVWAEHHVGQDIGSVLGARDEENGDLVLREFQKCREDKNSGTD